MDLPAEQQVDGQPKQEDASEHVDYGMLRGEDLSQQGCAQCNRQNNRGYPCRKYKRHGHQPQAVLEGTHEVGSMNEMQQGANNASIPATTAAMTDPPKKMLLSIRCPDFHAE